MGKQRFVYTVTINQDPIPGWNHEPDDFEAFLQRYLDNCIEHYDPMVEFIDHTEHDSQE